MLHQRNVTNLRPLAKLLPDVELYTIEMCGLQITVAQELLRVTLSTQLVLT